MESEKKSITYKISSGESSSLNSKSNDNKKQEHKKIRKAHKEKEKNIKELVGQIKKARTFMIVNIKNLPSKQFQEIKKSIREHVSIKVAKKNILRRVIDELKKESALPIKEKIEENCAFAISNMEGFELAGILSKNKTPIFAKAGQIASEDIEIKAGPTNLAPGPAISELGILGIQISVEGGKINVRQPKVVVKKGQEIKENVASLLQKLDIKPFIIGLEPIALYDTQEEKIYTNIKINSEEATENLRIEAGKALGFAQKIVYYCKETIGYLLAKANSQMKALERLSTQLNQLEGKKLKK